MEPIVKKKRNSIQNHIYYEKNKERINQQNMENHKKPEIVEYVRKFKQRPCTCLVCNQVMSYVTFFNHKKTKKHNNNYLNYNQSQPIMIIQA